MRAPALDPAFARVVADVERQGFENWHSLGVAAARRVEDDLFSGPQPEDGTASTDDGDSRRLAVIDRTVPGPAGPLPVRVVRPEREGRLPTLVFYHGGGWTLGTLDSVEPVCRDVAARVPCVVLAVDYRLAPEHPFPAPVDDCVAAYRWAREHAAEIGGDPDRVAVGGTSAGGTLAAAVSLFVRDRRLPVPDQQVLAYPATDHAFGTDSYRENADGPLLTRADMRWFWNQYLRRPADAADPYASVLRADLAGSPPATVLTAGFDPLRDDGVAFADALRAADVPVTHENYPALGHGFLSLTDAVPRADAAMTGLAERLSATLS